MQKPAAGGVRPGGPGGAPGGKLGGTAQQQLGTPPQESLEAIRRAKHEGGAGAAAMEASSQAGKQAAEKGLAYATGGASSKIPGVNKAAGKLGSVAGKLGFRAAMAGAGATAVVFLTILITLFGGSFTAILGSPTGGQSANAPEPTADQCNAMPANWCEALYNASLATAGKQNPVPWTLLAGLAEVQSDYGRTSPYDHTDRKPNRPTPSWLQAHAADLATQPTGNGKGQEGSSSSCGVGTPSPGIGGKGSQGIGPFLLTPAAVHSAAQDPLDGDPQDPCSAAQFVALQLSDAADALAQNNVTLDPSQPDKAATYWQKVIAQAAIFADPSQTGTPCTVNDPSHTIPISTLINSIWTCELDQQGQLNVVASATAGSHGKVSFSVYDRSEGASMLIDEAKAVSWNFSGWKSTGCNNKAALAGIFPLTAKTATQYGAADRCDIQANIRAAALAVAAGEQSTPGTRSTAAGPYAPMLGGWANVPAALGKVQARFSLNGPPVTWTASAACKNTIDTYLIKAARVGSPFAALKSATQAPVGGPYTAWLAATGSDPLADLSCGAPSGSGASSGAAAMSGEAIRLAAAASDATSQPSASPSPSPAPTGSTPAAASFDTSAMTGLSNWYQFAVQDVVPAPARWGVDSVIARLSPDSRTVATGPSSSTDTLTPVAAWQGRVTDWGIFYGGLIDPWNTFGQRTGSLTPTTGIGGADGSLVCDPGGKTFTAAGVTLSAQQLANAAAAVQAGVALKVPQQGLVVGMMVSAQEAMYRRLANPSVPDSMKLPHDGIGNDHDSVGMFQQRNSWGSAADRLDPAKTATLFFQRLLGVPGWQKMSPGVAAQTVQVSAYPDAYAKWQPLASAVVGRALKISCTSVAGSSPLGPSASAADEAKALLAMWGTKVTGNPGAQADLQATAAGQTINNSSSCGHTVTVNADLLRLYLIITTKYKVEIWNIVTGHGCDPFYHPSGNASDIGSVTELATGKHTNFYPGSAGNDPSVIAGFINFVASSGPSMLAMGQSECSDHAGGNSKYQAVSFPDSCTHQHINVHQNDPQFGPFSAETWPRSSS